ncbi:MAG TPA: hypothetical protein VGL53_11780 [Bryobacteraceae bacterium]
MKTCSDTEMEAVEEHLLVCEQCQTRLHCAEEWVALMKSALPLGPKRSKVRRWPFKFDYLFTRPFAMAGCAAIAVLLCAAPILMRDGPGEDQLVALTANRGADEQGIASAKAANRLILVPDVKGLVGPLVLEVVDSSGMAVFSQALPTADPRVRLDHRLKPGQYWVRINSAEADSPNLRESSLRIE